MVRRSDAEGADQLQEPRRVLAAGLVGRETAVRFAAEGLGHQPAKRRVDVGKIRQERLGVAGPIEVGPLAQLAADVQRIQHGSEAVEVGPGVNLALVAQKFGGCV